MWRECKENPKYFVSSDGKVKNKNGKELHQYLNRYGYWYVALGRKKYTVHRLVASAFLGDIEGMEIDHIDTDRKNNLVENLRIVTRKENANNPRTVLNLKKHGKKYAKTYGKKVTDKSGETYPSIIEAHRITGTPRSNIQYHLKQHTGEWNYV